MTDVSATWSPTGTAQHGDHENQSSVPFVQPGLGLRYQTCLLPTDYAAVMADDYSQFF